MVSTLLKEIQQSSVITFLLLTSTELNSVLSQTKKFIAFYKTNILTKPP